MELNLNEIKLYVGELNIEIYLLRKKINLLEEIIKELQTEKPVAPKQGEKKEKD